jgi:nitrate reductase NapE component
MSKKNSAPREQSQTKSFSDPTHVANISSEITQLNGKLVPVLQINSGSEQGKIVPLSNKSEIFLVKFLTIWKNCCIFVAVFGSIGFYILMLRCENFFFKKNEL